MNLLRAGRIFVFEPPPGVKANMLRTFSSIPVSRMCKVTSAGTMKLFTTFCQAPNFTIRDNPFFLSLFSQAPNERARLYFLLAWFHAVIQERLRYAPLGWSKKYEFGESDLRSACDTVDTWLDDTAKVCYSLRNLKTPELLHKNYVCCGNLLQQQQNSVVATLYPNILQILTSAF